MKKALLFSTCTALMFGAMPLSALAEDAARPDHYEGQEFSSTAQALGTIKEKNTEIQTIIDTTRLGISSLESIHEITYIIEDAIKVLKKDTNIDFDFTALAVELEGVHLNSESYLANKMKPHYTALQAELEKLYATYQ